MALNLEKAVKEIDKLVLDVECYSDLKLGDYVKKLRETEAWKTIKANSAHKEPRPVHRIKGDYIARYMVRKHCITFGDIKSMRRQ